MCIAGGVLAGLVSWPLYGTAGPWARAVLRPITSKGGPAWHRAGDKFQERVDKMPPGVANFFSLTASKLAACSAVAAVCAAAAAAGVSVF